MGRIILSAVTSMAAVAAFGVLGSGVAYANAPSQTTCTGVAGYDSSGTWGFQSTNVTVRTPTAGESLIAPCVNIEESAPEASQEGLASRALGTLGSIQISGTGNLSCGNGTLSGTVGETGGPYDWWGGTWSATFEHGVGTVTGTVAPLFAAPGEGSQALTGTILVADGPGTPERAFCNNDQSPSPAAISLSVG